MFLSPPNLIHNPNYSLTELNHVLQYCLSSNPKIGDTLVLLADNSAKDNKSVYNFAYASCLVATGVFKHVEFVFLLPGWWFVTILTLCVNYALAFSPHLLLGHNHYHADRNFAYLRSKFKKHNVVSPLEFIAMFRSVYTKDKYELWLVEDVADFSPFLVLSYLTL
jgi:hypothetical protein